MLSKNFVVGGFAGLSRILGCTQGMHTGDSHRIIPELEEISMNEVKKSEVLVEKNSKKERAATFVEYILLVTLIALAAVAVLRIFGQTVSTKFSGLNATILSTS